MAGDQAQRASPDALLALAKKEGRGHLKIFLGAAPGVGKTYAMLSRARSLKADGAEIDHVELFGPPADPANDSRNFVLCPGKAYDRSPCGTGTSAKLACLAADGRLEE